MYSRWFGLIEFKTELTGPEYLQRFVDQFIEFGIPYKLNTGDGHHT